MDIKKALFEPEAAFSRNTFGRFSWQRMRDVHKDNSTHKAPCDGSSCAQMETLVVNGSAHTLHNSSGSNK